MNIFSLIQEKLATFLHSDGILIYIFIFISFLSVGHRPFVRLSVCRSRAITVASQQLERRADPNYFVPLAVRCSIIADHRRSCRPSYYCFIGTNCMTLILSLTVVYWVRASSSVVKLSVRCILFCKRC